MATITEQLQNVIDNRDPDRLDIIVEAESGRGPAAEDALNDLGLDYSRVDVGRKTVFDTTVTQDQLAELQGVDAIGVLDHDPTFRPLGTVDARGGGGVTQAAQPAEDIRRVTLGEVMERFNVKEAWDLLGHRGEGVKVGVVDTPINENHPAIRDAVEGTASNGGQGLHGTWVASALVGDEYETTDGTIHGAAPDAELYSHGALSGGGASITEIADGINYCLEQGCDVMNISFGGSHSDVLESVVAETVNEGMVVVSSSGNSGPGVGSSTCPAHHSEVTSVGSISTNEEAAAFSSRGPGWNGIQKPDMAAYGGGSSLAGGSNLITESVLGAGTTGGEYLVGTSMASPQVAGIAALAAAAAKDAEKRTPAESTRDRIEKTTEGLGGNRTIKTGSRLYSPRSIATGSGIPDAARAVEAVETTILSDTATATAGVGLLAGAGYAIFGIDGE